MHRTAVYINGVRAITAPGFQLPLTESTGRLVLGDSTGQPDNWSGDLLGLAIYGRELTPAQVLQHYETWTRGKPPEIADNECRIALYLFGERAGRVVHNQARSDGNLSIPERYVVL